MSFLADLRTRLSGPVAACVEAAKAAAERAMTRLTPETEPGSLPPPAASAVSDVIPPLRPALPHRPAPAPAAVAPAAAVEPDPVEDAHMHLARLNTALAASGDDEVSAAGARFQTAVRALLDALSRHPAALPAHLRPLSAWVPGLASAAERYVSLQRQGPCGALRAELMKVLDQVARRISAHAIAIEGETGSQAA